MIQLPQEILKAWEVRDPVAVFTTVDAEGVPNTIYVSMCKLRPDGRVLIGDVHFGKTLDNLKQGRSQVSFLFFAKDYSAYQLKGQVRYASEGPLFEEGQCLAKPEFSLRGVVEIQITQVYKGSEELSA
ncbi:pyridoxamine 5'-phosphate oxidase family protein [Coraliomargarita algicola]|uniref:Pyridoxamine 5'-phosphate oxidase family protein n=1 Tax=Coraliomargarita algicola TaxID=3092156 RepID=A0ABZ0RSR8_9BACT|nr:pyridoxamine 5'-phosphate oxidase family protein [Coraliomargarita sp. J2-16]WPJ98108.1 pyridoxamine 5'-phosphate oxidase family protein [Coraliomargarita sp. J2-16]